MRPARHRTFAKLDLSKAREVEVTLDRPADTIRVRHLRRRRKFELPAGVVAQMIAERVVRAELAEARREKAAARLARRGGRR
jgi:antitoxin component of MazEF toxin-antitoxin module